MLVHDRLTVDILFVCHTASDDSHAVMLLMCYGSHGRRSVLKVAYACWPDRS